MGFVTPDFAATLATSAYSVNNDFQLKVLLKDENFSKNMAARSIVSATVGSRLIKVKDAFALFIRGTGDFEKDAFLLFRGTTGRKGGADVITDIRAGLTISSSGSFVHSGFNQVFTSLKNEVDRFLKEHSDLINIHCVGHSLGGAVASIAADWIKNTFPVKVKLYTFGCPRIGLGIDGFAQATTMRLGKENIHRVFHSNDAVTMVPVFPYTHAPVPNGAHGIGNGNLPISVTAHFMKGYADSVSGKKWENLNDMPETSLSINSIKQWLSSASEVNAADASVWHKFNYALAFIIQGSLIKVQAPFIGGLTLADHLAMLLLKVVALSSEFANWVFLLIRKMMKMLGMAALKTAEELTETLMRNVLTRIMLRINNEVRKALNSLF
ncbi:lipase family protein [Saccharophagus degradans]|uniref:Lipase, class 3 n=1 Tax=Saccharophagus degradans (strain 2-40 / ATCC 43961 / DSM 17024) TaxID=203122 RepID=Q21DY1_SACD2|nr:lipase family protein [Saccharophagus degradans]ABD83098.1 lipase, class 3 [Saccharophagus degradans 2-40]